MSVFGKYRCSRFFHKKVLGRRYNRGVRQSKYLSGHPSSLEMLKKGSSGTCSGILLVCCVCTTILLSWLNISFCIVYNSSHNVSRLIAYSFSSDWKWHPLVSKDVTIYRSGDAVAVIWGTTTHSFCICYLFSDSFRLSKPDSSPMLSWIR